MRKQQEWRSGRQWLVAVLAVALGLTVTGCSAQRGKQPRTRMGGGDLRNAACVQDLR